MQTPDFLATFAVDHRAVVSGPERKPARSGLKPAIRCVLQASLVLLSVTEPGVSC